MSRSKEAERTMEAVLDTGGRGDWKQDAYGSELAQAMCAHPRSFTIPAVPDPAAYCKQNFGVGYGTDTEQAVQFAKGTTTLAFKFQGGIIVSVRSETPLASSPLRASCSSPLWAGVFLVFPPSTDHHCRSTPAPPWAPTSPQAR